MGTTLSTALRYYLLIAPHILILGVCWVMVRRHLHRQFPIFFSYLVFETIQFAIAFWMILSASSTPSGYTTVYTIDLAGSTLLRFGILYEIFRHLVRHYAILERFGKPLLSWVAMGLLLAAVVLAFYTSGNGTDHLLYVIYVLDRTAVILQCGLLLALFALSSYLRLSWRSRVFGIALGVGVVASVELAAAALRTQLAFSDQSFLDYLTMSAYHFSVLIWLVYLWAPERSPQFAVKAVPQHDLEVWNEELQRLIQQ